MAAVIGRCKLCHRESSEQPLSAGWRLQSNSEVDGSGSGRSKSGHHYQEKRTDEGLLVVCGLRTTIQPQRRSMDFGPLQSAGARVQTQGNH